MTKQEALANVVQQLEQNQPDQVAVNNLIELDASQDLPQISSPMPIDKGNKQKEVLKRSPQTSKYFTKRKQFNADLIEDFFLPGKVKSSIGLKCKKSRTLLLNQFKQSSTSYNRGESTQQLSNNDYYQTSQISPWDDGFSNGNYIKESPYTQNPISIQINSFDQQPEIKASYQPKQINIIKSYTNKLAQSQEYDSDRAKNQTIVGIEPQPNILDKKQKCSYLNLIKIVQKRQQQLNEQNYMNRSQTMTFANKYPVANVHLKKFDKFPIRRDRIDTKTRSLSTKNTNITGKQHTTSSNERILNISDYQNQTRNNLTTNMTTTGTANNASNKRDIKLITSNHSYMSSQKDIIQQKGVYSVVNMNNKPAQLFTSDLITDSPLFKDKINQRTWNNLLQAQNNKVASPNQQLSETRQQQQRKYRKLADLLFPTHDYIYSAKTQQGQQHLQFDELRLSMQKKQSLESNLKIQQSKIKVYESTSQVKDNLARTNVINPNNNYVD